MRKLFIASALCAVLTLAAAAQVREATVRWHWAAPETEEFAVLLPEPPLRVRRDIPFSDELKLTKPVYEVAHRGVLFTVFSIAKKEVAAKTSDDFARALHHAIRQGSRTVANELTFEREVTHDKRTARQYLVRNDDHEGTAQVYDTPTHYYVLMTLGAQASELMASHFFNSFTLDRKRARDASDRVSLKLDFSQPPPYAPQPLWPVAGSSSGIGGVGGPVGPIGPIGPDNQNAPSTVQTPSALPPNAISGGVLNGKVISNPQPAYPPIARAARAQGTVAVQVLVDEEGYVISARAVSGHPLLQQAAVHAARGVRFAPTRLEGKPVKVQGVITYNFVLN